MAVKRNSKTIKDAYKEYAKENKNDKDFGIDYQLYRQICLEFNAYISDKILNDTYEFNLFGGLGVIRIKKLPASKQRRVDWATTKKSNVKVYHLNFHTDEYYYKWFWHKYKARFKNKSAYSFVPIRKNKRTLAALLKDNTVEYFR
jgi:6-pyruvoyl-tetrahydropterin synthase